MSSTEEKKKRRASSPPVGFVHSEQCCRIVEETGATFPFAPPTDKNGRIIVSDMGNHCMKVYSPEGNLLLKFGNSSMANNFLRPGGVVVTDRNNILVVHSSKDKHSKITAFNPDGHVIGTILDLDTQYGEIRSLSTQNKDLIVLGENFIHSYNMKENV